MDEMKRCSKCKTVSSLKHNHHQKGIKYNFLDYQNQFIKAHQFIKLNEEGFNDNILQGNIQQTSIEKLSNQQNNK